MSHAKRLLSPHNLVGAALLAVLLVLGSLPAAAGFTLTVEPARHEFMVLPGRPFTGAVMVRNGSPAELNVVGGTSNWTMTADGAMSVNSDPAAGCSQWVRFNPREFKLAPGKSQIVRFTVTAPPAAEPGEHRAAIIFRSSGPVPQGTGAVVVYSVAVPLYANVPIVKRTGRVELAKAEYAPGKGVSVEAVVEGTGNAHLRFEPSFRIVDLSGKIMGQGSLDQFVVLPGQTVTARGSWSGTLPPGLYSVNVEFQFEPPLYTKGLLFEYDYGDQKGKAALEASKSVVVEASQPS